MKNFIVNSVCVSALQINGSGEVMPSLMKQAER